MTMNNRISPAISRRIFAAFILLCGVLYAGITAQAADLPTAAGSPIAGITFDDRPLMLPAQRNFQMAMLTASSEMGRSCGRMEAYGWRMGENEQDRVNQIFDNTVDRMRAQGFSVEAKTASTVSRDVTLFTADRADKHLIFMWSAGEIGLVMVLCETSAPLPSSAKALPPEDMPATLPAYKPMAVSTPTSSRALPPAADQPARMTMTGKPVHEDFTPIGDWVGDYTCSQGTTGATLHITSLKGDQFEGTFHFYPTAKNPYVSRGKYKVFGEYDRDSLRILVNPGKWLERPKDFYNTIMIGSFDPVGKSFSGFFQGITGCTSFEARRGVVGASEPVTPKVKKAAVKKAPVKKAPAKVKKPAAKKVDAPAESKTELKVEPPTDMEMDAPAEAKADVKTEKKPAAKPETKSDAKPAGTTTLDTTATPRASSIEPPAGIQLPKP